jgi:hypothetical protein
MKRNNESEFAIKSQTGEIYLLNKKERILTTEILKMTLATETGREFLMERFGKGGLRIAADLLEEMGVQLNQSQGEKQKPAS